MALGAYNIMKNLFRYTVVISTVLFVMLWLLPYFDYLWLSEEQLNLALADGYGSYIPNHPLIYWSLFVAWFTISVGLFFFVTVARTAFFALLVITVLADFFWGFRVLPPISASISVIVTLSDGAILTMAYFTSVSNYFVKDT